MAVTNTTVLANDFQTYVAARLIERASKDTVFRQLGNQEMLPAGNSKTVSFTGYTKMAQTQTLLTEGVTPTDTALATTAITATVDQLGAYVTLTDLGELTVKHNVTQQAIQLLGDQAVESIDTMIVNVLLAGTTVQYADGVANRAALAATNVMDSNEFRKAVKLLRRNGAPTFEDGLYRMVVDPEVEADITTDSQFVAGSQYSALRKLEQNEVGTWLGIRVMRSNNLATIASTTTVHTSLVFGRGAFAVVDLQPLRTYVEASGGNSDPLHQRKTIGWKTAFKAVRLNESFMLRIESGSAF